MNRAAPHILLAALIGMTSLLHMQCSRREGGSEKKIKLDRAAMRQTETSARLATTLQVQPEERRSIAIFYFENITADEELDWMRRGLTEMLITDLSQFRYLDVFGEHDLEAIMRRMGIKADRSMDASLAVAVAKEARVETVLIGGFVKVGENIRIEVQLLDARTGSLLKADLVECQGLEEVFPMVDELTRRVRDGLRPTLKDVVEFDKDLADVTTSSVEAYRYFAEGQKKLDMIYYEEAAEDFEKAVEIDPDFATAYARLSRSYSGMGRRSQAIEAVEKAVSLVDRVTEREQLNILALEASFKGDAKRIIETYERMVELFPKDKEARFRLGSVYYSLERFDEAITQFEAALRIDNTYKHVYNMLGYAYASQGMYKKALENHQRYIELVPDEPNPHDSMGEIYQQAGLLDEAIKRYKEALRLKSDLHFPWEHMGNTLMEKGEFDKAARIYKRYIELCPSDYLKSYGHALVGEAHWAKGEFEEAYEAYREAQKMSPQSYYLISRIGTLLEARGDTVEARKHREEWFWNEGENVLEEDNFAVVSNFIGVCLYNDLHPEELDPFIDRAMELAENDFNRALCVMQQGAVSLKQGLSDSALTHFQSAARTFLTIETAQGMGWDDIRNISQAIAGGPDDQEEDQIFLEKMITVAREMDNVALEASIRFFLLEYLETHGDEEDLEQMLQATGSPRESDWWIIGPFENKNGLQKRFPPEREIKLKKSYKGKGGKVRWHQADDRLFEGYVNLKELLKPNIWVVAYGLLSFQCPTVRDARLRIGTNEATRVWLNGREVWIRNLRRGAIVDDDIIPVTLQEGKNTVLIKVCQKIGEWGFYFRITDPEGKPFGDVTYIPQVVS